MSEKIKWSFTIEVVGGPKISDSKTLELEAYDKIQVTVPSDATNKDVQIQPGGTGQVVFLLIRSTLYDDTQLTYKVKDSSGEGATEYKLDAPQMLIGKGSVNMLEKAPSSLIFKNAIANNNEGATIDIFVGRDATP